MYWREGIPKEIFKWNESDCDNNRKKNVEFANLRMYFIERNE